MIDFQLVDRPLFFPGVNVDNTQDGPCVDTHYTLPRDEHVYLSRRTVRDAARLFPDLVAELAEEIGHVSADEHLETLADRDAQIAELQADLAELVPVRDFISKYGDRAADEPIRKTGRAAA